MPPSFGGDIASTSDGWQRYGIHLGGEDDEGLGDFAFYPKLFIQPLRKKIETQLQFQEMMSVSCPMVYFLKQTCTSSSNNSADGKKKTFLFKSTPSYSLNM
jgi:hypothetical protein